jgi:hypothetical protein
VLGRPLYLYPRLLCISASARAPSRKTSPTSKIGGQLFCAPGAPPLNYATFFAKDAQYIALKFQWVRWLPEQDSNLRPFD